MQAEQVLFHFTSKLETLKDWPDKNIIMELTAYTEASIAIAPHFVNIVGLYLCTMMYFHYFGK
jgi:hypothetical protein